LHPRGRMCSLARRQVGEHRSEGGTIHVQDLSGWLRPGLTPTPQQPSNTVADDAGRAAAMTAPGSGSALPPDRQFSVVDTAAGPQREPAVLTAVDGSRAGSGVS
jgi:hypothetical protein